MRERGTCRKVPPNLPLIDLSSGASTEHYRHGQTSLQPWEERHAKDFHQAVRRENDAFIDGRTATSESGGFLELAEMLGLST